MLTITDLHAVVGDQPILRGLDLTVPSGQVHAIMGPNASGKSTLAKVIAGHPAYTVTKGSVRLDADDLLTLDPETRARRGVFIGWQHPVEVPGVHNRDFLRLALNAARKARGEPELTAKAFAPLLADKLRECGLEADWADRQVNAGMSGGQKKRNEMLQMIVLEPRLAVLDETDSGLDIDALRIVAEGINRFRRADRSIVLITHFQRLLDLVVPERIHVLAGGRMVASGGPELAAQLERDGYDQISAAR